VGFPGEDDEDFAATVDLMRRVRYDAAFLFKYSRRDGTRAGKWDETVCEEEKGRRLQAVIALQEATSAEINRALVGQTVEVLVEGPARRHEGWMMGKTPQMKTAAFPGPAMVGSLVSMRVESSTAHSLRGFSVQPGA
jgi:tRNA-2-methylthio-N6-dimethylallyladenosine synthase